MMIFNIVFFLQPIKRYCLNCLSQSKEYECFSLFFSQFYKAVRPFSQNGFCDLIFINFCIISQSIALMFKSQDNINQIILNIQRSIESLCSFSHQVQFFLRFDWFFRLLWQIVYDIKQICLIVFIKNSRQLLFITLKINMILQFSTFIIYSIPFGIFMPFIISDNILPFIIMLKIYIQNAKYFELSLLLTMMIEFSMIGWHFFKISKNYDKYKLIIKQIIFVSSINQNIEYICSNRNLMDADKFGVVSNLQLFESFFIGIQQDKINGFQSQMAQKLKRNYDSLRFDEAKNIFLQLQSKDLYKMKKNWKHDQVLLFLFIVDKACLKLSQNFLDFSNELWNEISQLIPGRDGESCKTKMLSLVPANLNDAPWIEIQQQILAEIIQKEGVTKWKNVSLKLFEKNPTHIYRSSKQCRQRYMCFLKPNLKKGYWSDQEDYQLITLFLKLGRKWSKMTQYIHGRNENAIKNRFFLLFEESSRNQKLYYSQFMRKVLRRKQKLQKILGVVPSLSHKIDENPKIENENIQIVKSESNSTQRDFKYQQFAEIQKFFTF